MRNSIVHKYPLNHIGSQKEIDSMGELLVATGVLQTSIDEIG